MILSDNDIKNALSKGLIQIKPFQEKNLTPNGYDLTVKTVYIDGIYCEETIIKPLSWFAVATEEYIVLRHITAQLWIRSTYARKGVMSSFGKVDAGFEGCLTLSCFNTHEPFPIKKGDRICQIVFEYLASEPSQVYKGKYSGHVGIKL